MNRAMKRDQLAIDAWSYFKKILNLAAVGERVGVTRQALAQWPQVPTNRVRDVEVATGIRWQWLRPDLDETLTDDDLSPWLNLETDDGDRN